VVSVVTLTSLKVAVAMRMGFAVHARIDDNQPRAAGDDEERVR